LPDGLGDVVVFGIDHSEDGETCDEICRERHGKILKRALIIFNGVIHRVTISPESVHGQDPHNSPENIEYYEQADADYDLMHKDEGILISYHVMFAPPCDKLILHGLLLIPDKTCKGQEEN
jgi:hypothetical protein